MAQVTPGTTGVRGWRQDHGPEWLEECDGESAPHLDYRVARS
jgi:hypothetical protein